MQLIVKICSPNISLCFSRCRLFVQDSRVRAAPLCYDPLVCLLLVNIYFDIKLRSTTGKRTATTTIIRLNSQYNPFWTNINLIIPSVTFKTVQILCRYWTVRISIHVVLKITRSNLVHLRKKREYLIGDLIVSKSEIFESKNE